MIEASSLERPDPTKIFCLDELQTWKGEYIGWFCVVRDDVYTLLHCDKTPHNKRPWFTTYDTALSLIETIPDIEIVEVMTAKEYFNVISKSCDT